MSLTIQPMTYSDLIFAAACTAAEGWAGADLETFENFHDLDPDGCFLAVQDGQPAGTCIGTCYGKSGFVGALIVQPELRGQGIGAALLQHTLDYLHRRGIESIYLDGVVKAVPLYERHGFRKICRSLRFYGTIPSKANPNVYKARESDWQAIFDLDRQVFGADRSYFLEKRLRQHPQLFLVMLERGNLTGYISARKGDGWISMGPMVTANEANPLPLLERFSFELDEQPFSAGVLESNQDATALFRSLGMQERADCPWRMSTGPAKDLGASPNSWAIGSAAKG